MGVIRRLSGVFTLPPCEACGEVRVIHSLEKLLSIIEDHYKHPSFRKVHRKKVHARTRLKVWRWFEKMKLCALHSTAVHTNDSRVHALFEGAAASRLTLLEGTILGKHMCFFLTDSVGKVLMFDNLPHELLPYTAPIPIDDKYELSQFISKNNLRMPKTWCVKEKSHNQLPHASQESPLITKPCVGTRGRHTTLHHTSMQSLCKGIALAHQISTRVVVQEELQGTVYRFTVINGEKVYVGKRDYPYIVGDGSHSVEELVLTENRKSFRDGIYFRKIVFGDHERLVLEKKGITSSYIPKHGEVCVVSDKNSRRNGTVVEDVTDDVHPSIMQYVIHAARLLKSPALGFDVILANHTAPLDEQSGGIIECNSVPYLDVHHRVVSGRQHNVAAELFQLVLAEYNLQKVH